MCLLLSCLATFHWLRLASCDCRCTVLSFRPHKLPHTDTGYVQQSFFCLLLFKEHQWSSQSLHLQDWPHGFFLFFFLLFLFHSLAEIMTSRTVFVKEVHMTRLMAPYLSCQSCELSSRSLERGETERAGINSLMQNSCRVGFASLSLITSIGSR